MNPIAQSHEARPVRRSGDPALVRSRQEAERPKARPAAMTGTRATDVILAVAADQHGLVTSQQLQRAGLSRHVIERRVKVRMLRSVHAGVYQVGPITAPHARELAAVLACPGAVASHRTSAGLWQLPPAPAGHDPVDITVPPECSRGRRPGIRVHRSALATDEIGQLDGIPLTSPARTILDLSQVVTARVLERAVAQAERERLVQLAGLQLLLDRYPRRAGTRRLRALIERDTPPAHTRSEAEERLHALIRLASLPEPEMNVKVEGIEVDFFWRKAKLVVEVDGYAYHTSIPAFIRDHQWNSALAAAGIQVIRLSWHQLEFEREKTLVQIARALALALR